MEANCLQFKVKSEVVTDPAKGPIAYMVTVKPAKGKGESKGRSKQDKKLGVEFVFTCECRNFIKHKVCKHIGAVCIVHFN